VTWFRAGGARAAGPLLSEFVAAADHMSQHPVQGSRHPIEVERLDEVPRVADFPAAAAAHEAVKLVFEGATLPRRLLLECPKGGKVTVALDDLLGC